MQDIVDIIAVTMDVPAPESPVHDAVELRLREVFLRIAIAQVFPYDLFEVLADKAR